jgi:hypothetical protein
MSFGDDEKILKSNGDIPKSELCAWKLQYVCKLYLIKLLFKAVMITIGQKSG